MVVLLTTACVEEERLRCALDGAQRGLDRSVGVEIARICDGIALQPGGRVALGVVDVEAEKRDLTPVADGDLLIDRKLGLAGQAPGRPQVDDDRMAAERTHPRVE